MRTNFAGFDETIILVVVQPYNTNGQIYDHMSGRYYYHMSGQYY